MELIPAVGALIAFTQACIAFAVFSSSGRQRSVDRGTQRVIRIHDWGNDCIDALAKAGQLCLLQVSDFPDEGAYTIQRSNLLHRLSALIDRGRLFYRNIDQEKYGREKFPARRGYRPEILDPLVAAYRSLLAMSGSANQDSFERLYRWRGALHFTASIRGRSELVAEGSSLLRWSWSRAWYIGKRRLRTSKLAGKPLTR